MCSQQQVGKKIVNWNLHQRPRACPTCSYMIYKHRVFKILNIFHDPIWFLVAQVNVYLTLLHHGVLRADRKMAMLGTELYHMKLSPMCVENVFSLRHDTHTYSTFVYWIIFFILHYKSLLVYVFGLKDVFKFPCQNDFFVQS